jgi:hypothetical protein
MNLKYVVIKRNSNTKVNKRAKMALDRSPDPSKSSEQLPRKAFSDQVS